MKYFAGLTILAMVMLQPAAAIGSGDGKASPPDERQVVSADEKTGRDFNALSARLNEILDHAIGAKILGDRPDPQPAGRAIAPAGAQAPHAEVLDCSEPYPLDFKPFEALTDYLSLLEIEEGKGAGTDLQARAQSLLAIGLTSEARLAIRASGGQKATAVRKLADLLEQRVAPDTAYFDALAACYAEASLWQGVAQLQADDASGAGRLEKNLGGFRSLPLQLRADVAALAIPVLERHGVRQISVKLMADFTQDDIRRAARLRFCADLIAFGRGEALATRSVMKHLHSAHFRADAFAALADGKVQWQPLQAGVVLEDAGRMLATARTPGEISRLLKYLLSNREFDYDGIDHLSNTQSLASPGARTVIAERTLEKLKEDIEGDAAIRKLAAFEFLIGGADILNELAERESIYKQAADSAQLLGYPQLSGALLATADSASAPVASGASLAFRKKDYATLFAIADAAADQIDVQMLAARAAIRQNDAARLRAIERRIKMTPERAFVLISEDAIAGHWIVSQGVYAMAAQQKEPAALQRAEQIIRLKNPALQPPAVSAVSVRKAPDAVPQTVTDDRPSDEPNLGVPDPVEDGGETS